MPLLETTQDLLRLCHVPRWVIVPHSRSQSVAEHSFRVAAIVGELLLTGVARVEVDDQVLHRMMAAALFHDQEEAQTGDIPSTFKAKYPAMFNRTIVEMVPMSPHERAVLKLADLMETYTYICAYGGSGRFDPSEAQASTRVWCQGALDRHCLDWKFDKDQVWEITKALITGGL